MQEGTRANDVLVNSHKLCMWMGLTWAVVCWAGCLNTTYLENIQCDVNADCSGGKRCIEGLCLWPQELPPLGPDEPDVEGCDPAEHQSDEVDCGCKGPCADNEACVEGLCVDDEATCIPEDHQSDAIDCGCDGPCAADEVCVEGLCDTAPLEECVDGVCVATAVLVPAGPFTMGANNGNPDEAPRREITLTRSYFIQRTEVTQEQFEDLMGSNPAGHGPNGNSTLCEPNCPVESVTWFDAANYCNALSLHQGLEPCFDNVGNVIGGANVYDCEGWRLPTEAEWEKAARGTDGPTYPWGEETPTCEFTVMRDDDNGGHGCGAEQPLPVGSRPLGVSPYGLHDMIGNISEWVADWHEERTSFEDDPTGPSSGRERIIRGSSWAVQDAAVLRTFNRDELPPTEIFRVIGFRCARSN